jgi:Arc/MetJ-type ribon-helix-helix transcriptional regulator
MNYLYPLAVFHEPENEKFNCGYGAIIYDLMAAIVSEANSLDDIIRSARGVIEKELSDMASRGELPPKPTSVDVSCGNPDFEDAIWLMIEVNIDPYLGKSSKINITLPDSVIKEVDRLTDGREVKYKNRSQFIRRCVLKEVELYNYVMGDAESELNVLLDDKSLVKDTELISTLRLSQTTGLCLKAEGIAWVNELVLWTAKELTATPNIGLKRLREIERSLNSKGLALASH